MSDVTPQAASSEEPVVTEPVVAEPEEVKVDSTPEEVTSTETPDEYVRPDQVSDDTPNVDDTAPSEEEVDD